MDESNKSPQLWASPPQKWSGLLGLLEFGSIISDWIEFHPSWINATLEGFINGERVEISLNEIQNLKSLNKSFRLTNIQLYHGPVKKLCDDFYLETNKVMTANLYFTPHSEAQCFTWHSDNQHSLTYQLSGEKRWSFLQKNNVFLKETHEQEIVLKDYLAKKIEAQEEHFHLKKGSWLTFPYCLLHKAQNLGAESSVHITFAYNHPTVLDFAKFLQGHIMEDDYREIYYKPVNIDQFIKNLPRLDITKSDLLKKFYDHFKEIEDSKKKYGRPYG